MEDLKRKAGRPGDDYATEVDTHSIQWAVTEIERLTKERDNANTLSAIIMAERDMALAENERMRVACVAVDELWSNNALSFPDEMAIPSPGGLVWAKVKEALHQYQQSTRTEG